MGWAFAQLKQYPPDQQDTGSVGGVGIGRAERRWVVVAWAAALSGKNVSVVAVHELVVMVSRAANNKPCCSGTESFSWSSFDMGNVAWCPMLEMSVVEAET